MTKAEQNKKYEFMGKYGVILMMLITGVPGLRAQYPGQHRELVKVALKAPIKAYSFDLRDVRLLDSRFRQNMEREEKWILSLPNERLLHSFYVNAGMLTNKQDSKTKMPQPLGGWEQLDMELRGHSVGHILSGLSLLYAATGEDQYKRKGDSIITALAEIQRVLNQDGYLSAFPQNYIDRNIAGKAVWAPWYTLHKIMAGLLDMYWNAGNSEALEIAKKMASWSYKKLSTLSEATLTTMLRNEFGGMNEAFFNLYSITGDPRHLELARKFYHHAALDPLAEREDKLKGLHANTIIPKIVGEARAYELTNDARDSGIASFFWDIVVKDHTYAHGGNSDKEHFFAPDKLSEHLTGNTGETCNTYNMLKVTRHLFSWFAEAKYADYYEQALYNHILGQQDPATGMVCYFTPMESGSYRLYSTPDQSFWCCVGSGFESQAKFGEAIYYHDENGVFVNLFIPSELTWKDKGIKIVQETKYPEEATTRLTVYTGLNDAGSARTKSFSLYIRYPGWAIKGAAIKVNGKSVRIVQSPGSYITINRAWKSGDKVEITYPMTLRWIPTPDNPKIAAIAYGPIVLAAPEGTEGMVAPAPYHDPRDPYQYYGYDYHIPSDIVHTLKTGERGISTWLRPVVGEPLTFVTAEGIASRPIRMVPYYEIHRQRYVIYWDID